MRKTLIASAAVFALSAGSALAAVITVEFAPAEGEAQVWTFDQATNKATAPSGETYDYTYDEAARKLCAETKDGPLCATFEGADGEMKVGASASYTATNDTSGTATVIDIKE